MFYLTKFYMLHMAPLLCYVQQMEYHAYNMADDKDM